MCHPCPRSPLPGVVAVGTSGPAASPLRESAPAAVRPLSVSVAWAGISGMTTTAADCMWFEDRCPDLAEAYCFTPVHRLTPSEVHHGLNGRDEFPLTGTEAVVEETRHDGGVRGALDLASEPRTVTEGRRPGRHQLAEAPTTSPMSCAAAAARRAWTNTLWTRDSPCTASTSPRPCPTGRKGRRRHGRCDPRPDTRGCAPGRRQRSPFTILYSPRCVKCSSPEPRNRN